MAHARTKSGTLPLDDGKTRIVLTEQGQEIPNDLAKSIRGHVNVEVTGLPEDEPSADDLDPRTNTPKAKAAEVPASNRPANPAIESPAIDASTGRPVAQPAQGRGRSESAPRAEPVRPAPVDRHKPQP